MIKTFDDVGLVGGKPLRPRGWQAIHQLIATWREEARSKSLDPEYQDAWKKADELEAALAPVGEGTTPR